MDKAVNWLLGGPPWVQYRTRIDLLDQDENDLEVASARRGMLTNPVINALISELAEWPGSPLKRHNDASQTLHKLVFLADLGIKIGDPSIDKIADRILRTQSKEGAFQVLTNIPPRYGGSGEDQLAWMLCDTPSITYSILKLGVRENVIRSASQHLTGLALDNGWPCAVSPVLGKFRGPGRKTDPCPYATLIGLKALAQMPEWRDSKACITGADTLLNLWKQHKERRPYMFAMGTDFTKLKAPMVWYDILHVLDVLSQFPHLKKDKRLLEMIDTIKTKSDDDGRFTAESAWKAWSEWEFGQKKVPSFWITFLVHRLLKRIS